MKNSYLSNSYLPTVYQVFINVIQQVQLQVSNVHSVTEFHSNETFPLRGILRFSLNNRSILGTVDVKISNNRKTFQADICLDEGKVFVESDSFLLEDIEQFEAKIQDFFSANVLLFTKWLLKEE